MNQKERRKYLIKELLAEVPGYSDIVIPDEEDAQKRLLRSLMNVRSPHPVSSEFLKGVTDSASLQASPLDSRLILWQGDITTLKIDAIVNAANSALRGCFVPCHSCIDNIIHSMSGIQLRLTCDRIMNEQGHEEPMGKATITPAYNLPAQYVIHTVGPIVTGTLTKTHCRQLADCYRSCLELASVYGLKSITFCCISTGEFHFPQQKAAEIAVETVMEFLKTDTGIERVVFNVFKESDYEIYRNLLG